MLSGIAFRALASILLLTIPVHALAAVGRTVGTFNVSPGGTGTYSIPLWSPPGPNGLAPQFGLTYSSGAGNGLVGVGWNVAGLSSIHRCYKTWAQDGLADPWNTGTSSRLCLDGQQLRLVSGTYGSTSAEYRTEIDNFSRITAQGTAGNGAAWFKVEARNGLIYEYGNSVLFTYTEDATNRSYRVAEVTYPYLASVLARTTRSPSSTRRAPPPIRH